MRIVKTFKLRFKLRSDWDVTRRLNPKSCRGQDLSSRFKSPPEELSKSSRDRGKPRSRERYRIQILIYILAQTCNYFHVALMLYRFYRKVHIPSLEDGTND